MATRYSTRQIGNYIFGRNTDPLQTLFSSATTLLNERIAGAKRVRVLVAGMVRMAAGLEASRDAAGRRPFSQDSLWMKIVLDCGRDGAGRGSDCRYVLILTKLLKILKARNYQNAANTVLEYATSTRNFRRICFALGRSWNWEKRRTGSLIALVRHQRS